MRNGPARSILVVACATGTYRFGPGAGLAPGMRDSFKAHSLGIGIHIFASALALLFGPFQLSSSLRNRWPAARRLMGQAYLGIGILSGGIAGLSI